MELMLILLKSCDGSDEAGGICKFISIELGSVSTTTGKRYL
jgi:hypothetical protein